MSFLDSVLTSIETGKPSPIPPPTPATRQPSVSLTSASKASSEIRNTNPRPRDVSLEGGNTSAGTKRKAEEQLRRPLKTGSQPMGSTNSKPTAVAPKPRTVATTAGLKQATKPTSDNVTSTASKMASSAVPSRAPPKGSYADLMKKAKELQQKAPMTVGMLKHQAAPKEKLSKTERKRRASETQVKEKGSKLVGKGSAISRAGVESKAGIVSTGKVRTPEETSYKGTARSTQPPPQPEYRGTAGLPSKRGLDSMRGQYRYGRRSRMDEYLGTDEEDEGDYADDYDDYYSDDSDMEAGLEDVEQEEQEALKVARREDEEEYRAELAAKKAKMERQKKLAALATRRR